MSITTDQLAQLLDITRALAVDADDYAEEVGNEAAYRRNATMEREAAAISLRAKKARELVAAIEGA